MKNKKNQLSIKNMQDLVFECMKYIHAFCLENNISYYMIGGTLLGAIRSSDFIPWDEDADIAMKRDDYERFYNLKNKFDNEKYFIEFYRSNKYSYCFHMRVCIKNTLVSHKKFAKGFGRELQVDVFPLDFPPISEACQAKQVKIFKRTSFELYFKSVGYTSNIFRNLRRLLAKIFLVFKSTKSICKKADNVARFAFGKPQDTTHLVSMASHYPYSKQYMDSIIYGKPTLYAFREVHFFGVEQSDSYLKQIYGDDYMMPKKDVRELDLVEKHGLLLS